MSAPTLVYPDELALVDLLEQPVWYPEEPSDVLVDVALIALSYDTLCLLWYQMAKIIIKYGIHLYMCHSRRNKDNMVFGNTMCVAGLPHDALKQMRKCETWAASRKPIISSITLCCQMTESHYDRHSYWSSCSRQSSGKDTLWTTLFPSSLWAGKMQMHVTYPQCKSVHTSSQRCAGNAGGSKPEKC